ncbi:MAG: 4Fe-4S single cluster domain-containing protein [Atribacterota bacterium]
MPGKDTKTVLIHLLIYPLFGLGFGKRGGIFFQGCSIHCPGCMAQETWSFDPQKAMSLREVTNVLARWYKEGMDGLTISGGEPFDQSGALLEILKAAHSLGIPEILVYSGYPFSFLAKHYPHILKRIDLLISEPYRADLPTRKPWRGSDNQVLHVLSTRAKERYAQVDLNAPSPLPGTIQVLVEDEKVVIIGLFSTETRKKVHKLLGGIGYGPCQGVSGVWQRE